MEEYWPDVTGSPHMLLFCQFAFEIFFQPYRSDAWCIFYQGLMLSPTAFSKFILATKHSVATRLCSNQVAFSGKHVFWVSSCQAIYALGSLSCFNSRHATLSNGLRPRFMLMKPVNIRLTPVVNLHLPVYP